MLSIYLYISTHILADFIIHLLIFSSILCLFSLRLFHFLKKKNPIRKLNPEYYHFIKKFKFIFVFTNSSFENLKTCANNTLLIKTCEEDPEISSELSKLQQSSADICSQGNVTNSLIFEYSCFMLVNKCVGSASQQFI